MDKQNELTKKQKQEDKYLIAKVLDKIKFAKSRNRFEATDFFDLSEQQLVIEMLEKIKENNYILFGGYTTAERKILIASNNIEYIKSETYNDFMKIIRIKLPNDLKGRYEHRNYLGALIKLGIKREKIGDILVRDDGADIIVKSDIAEYTKNDLKTLTRFQKSNIEMENIENLIYIEKEKQIIKINIPSMRLDCIVGELAKCSRAEANKYLEAEKVFVNFKEEIRTSKILKEGDYVTIRGKGRFKISKILGNTKSGRLSVEIEK